MDTLARQVQFIGAIGNTHCALAPGAMEPLQSAMKYFPDDFTRHIDGGVCPYCDGENR
jgi:NADH-quinone oxidoreductase subunit F